MCDQPPDRCVISVLARDHVGIIADVSDTLYSLDANIEALSQTVVGQWFTMVVCATFPATVDHRRIKEAIESAGEWQALVAPFDVAEPSARPVGEPYVVTTVGADRPGIVRRFARCFADHGVNIEDVWNEVQEDQFIEIFHVTLPSNVDPNELRLALTQAAAELDVAAHMQHQDIFTATTSLSVHTKK